MVLIGLAGVAAGGGPVFVVGCILFAAHLGWQIERLDIDDPALCLRLFKSNRDAGLILFAALIGDALYKYYLNVSPLLPYFSLSSLPQSSL